MGLFRRSRAVRPERSSLHPAFDSVEVGVTTPRVSIADQRLVMRRLAAEALILQDQAAEIINGVRARQPLGQLAPRGGPIVHRFFCLRDELAPHYDDPDLERMRGLLDVVLHHDAMLLSTSLELLAYEWRSERLSQQIDTLDGLGAPALWLESVYAELDLSIAEPRYEVMPA